MNSLVFPILASLPLLSLSRHTSAPRLGPPRSLAVQVASHVTQLLFPRGSKVGQRINSARYRSRNAPSTRRFGVVVALYRCRGKRKAARKEGEGARLGKKNRDSGRRGKNGKEAREEKHVAAATSTFLGEAALFLPARDPASTVVQYHRASEGAGCASLLRYISSVVYVGPRWIKPPTRTYRRGYYYSLSLVPFNPRDVIFATPRTISLCWSNVLGSHSGSKFVWYTL